MNCTVDVPPEQIIYKIICKTGSREDQHHLPEASTETTLATTNWNIPEYLLFELDLKVVYFHMVWTSMCSELVLIDGLFTFETVVLELGFFFFSANFMRKTGCGWKPPNKYKNLFRTTFATHIIFYVVGVFWTPKWQLLYDISVEYLLSLRFVL